MEKFCGRIFLVLLCLILSGCGAKDKTQLPPAYGEILEDIIAAYPWSEQELSAVPQRPELSYLYRQATALDQIGYTTADLDGNGQAELILVSMDSAYFYDLYTLSDGIAIHLADSGERYPYYLRENGYVEQQWSGSAFTSGYDFYRLEKGALNFVERITFDAYYAVEIGRIGDFSEANEGNGWFKSQSDAFADYVPITAEEAKAVIDTYEADNPLLEIEFTSLGAYQKP